MAEKTARMNPRRGGRGGRLHVDVREESAGSRPPIRQVLDAFKQLDIVGSNARSFWRARTAPSMSFQRKSGTTWWSTSPSMFRPCKHGIRAKQGDVSRKALWCHRFTHGHVRLHPGENTAYEFEQGRAHGFARTGGSTTPKTAFGERSWAGVTLYADRARAVADQKGLRMADQPDSPDSRPLSRMRSQARSHSRIDRRWVHDGSFISSKAG